jgi:hypothetical protein
MFLVGPKQKQHLAREVPRYPWKAFEEFRKASTTCGLSPGGLQGDQGQIARCVKLEKEFVVSCGGIPVRAHLGDTASLQSIRTISGPMEFTIPRNPHCLIAPIS